MRDDEDIVQIPYCSERPDAILAISLKLYEYNPKLSTRHRDSHLDFIGHDFMPSKLHRALALQDKPRCVYDPARSILKENAMETNTLLLIVIVLLLLGGGYYGRKRWF